MAREQSCVEVSIEEDIGRKKSPVDRPLKHELSAEVERHDHITLGILDEKPKPERDLLTNIIFFLQFEYFVR